MNWIKTSDELPQLNKVVLLHLPFCDYGMQSGYYNGTEWLSTDRTTEIFNVEHWMPLPDRPCNECENSKLWKDDERDTVIECPYCKD